MTDGQELDSDERRPLYDNELQALTSGCSKPPTASWTVIMIPQIDDHWRISLFILASLVIRPGLVMAQDVSSSPDAQRIGSVDEESRSDANAPSATTRTGDDAENQPDARNQSPLEAFRAVSRAALADRRKSISTKVHRYAAKVIERYDEDGDGVLSSEEWRQMRGTPRLADLNGDGRITATEMAARVASYAQRRSIRLMPGQYKDSPGAGPIGESEPLALSGGDANVTASDNTNLSVGADAPDRPMSPMTEFAAQEPSKDQEAAELEAARRSRQFFVPKERLPQAASAWYLKNDANGDGQITMAEFSTTWSRAEAIEFARYDADGNGVITAREFQRNSQAKQPKGGEKQPPTVSP